MEHPSTLSADSAAGLAAVIATDELGRRPSRPPDLAAENRALVALAQEMASSPRRLLQTLAETALELCHADSAGLSLLESADGAQIFRWHAVAGVFAPNVFGTTPRDFSPCGTVLDRHEVMLFERPGLHFRYLDEVSPRIVEALLVPLDVGGEPVGTIWVMSNDERCRFDREDGRVLTNLATFASASYQILTSLERAKLADQNKTEFLAMLAHELRNPLAPIRNSLDVLRLSKRGDAVIEPLTEIMERQLGHIVRLVDDLLDASRISLGKIELRRVGLELAQVVQQAVEAATPLVEEKKHELRVVLPDKPIHLSGDPTRLVQVIGNLLNNACKFSEPGGQIELSLERHEREAVLRVRDRGIGLAPDQLTHVFELFKQVDKSAARAQGGLGVGLSLVKKLIELHGGSVAAFSAGLGQGSEFVVRLPLEGSS